MFVPSSAQRTQFRMMSSPPYCGPCCGVKYMPQDQPLLSATFAVPCTPVDLLHSRYIREYINTNAPSDGTFDSFSFQLRPENCALCIRLSYMYSLYLFWKKNTILTFGISGLEGLYTVSYFTEKRQLFVCVISPTSSWPRKFYFVRILDLFSQRNKKD